MKRLRLPILSALLAALLTPTFGAAAPRRIGSLKPSLVNLKITAPTAALSPALARPLSPRQALAPLAVTPALAASASAALQQAASAPLQEFKKAAQAVKPDQDPAETGRKLFDGAGAKAAVKEWFGGFVQSIVQNPDLVETRAKRLLPGLRSAHFSTWKTRQSTLPEQNSGVSTGRALKLLSELKNKKDPAAGGRHIRNATYSVNLSDGQRAVVKKVYRRSDMGENKVVHVTNDVRYEVLAFQLDRYLGTNLVPPAILIDKQTSAQLKVNARAINPKEAAQEPANLMEMSHHNLIDMLMMNYDHWRSDNLLVDEHGKIIAIDFDLSRPDGFAMEKSFDEELHIPGVMLEPEKRFWGRGSLPGVYSKKVIARLKRLDGRRLEVVARANGFTLSDKEIGNILSQGRSILQGIEILRARYGDELILAP